MASFNPIIDDETTQVGTITLNDIIFTNENDVVNAIMLLPITTISATASTNTSTATIQGSPTFLYQEITIVTIRVTNNNNGYYDREISVCVIDQIYYDNSTRVDKITLNGIDYTPLDYNNDINVTTEILPITTISVTSSISTSTATIQGSPTFSIGRNTITVRVINDENYYYDRVIYVNIFTLTTSSIINNMLTNVIVNYQYPNKLNINLNVDGSSSYNFNVAASTIPNVDLNDVTTLNPNWFNSYSNKILFFIVSNNIININGNTDNFNFVNNSLINIEFYYNNDLKMSIPTFCTLTKLTTKFTFLEGTYPNIGHGSASTIGLFEFYFYPLYPLVNSLTNTPYLFETLNDINGPIFYEDFFKFNIKSNSSLCYNTTQLTLLNTRITSITFPSITTTQPTGFVCFKEGSRILTDQGYRLIEELRPGDLVKTELNDYKPIVMMGKKEIYHLADETRIKDQLYQCSPQQYPELTEELIITGCHCILVDDLTDEQRTKSIEVNGKIYITGNKYRLPACVDERTTVYDKKGKHTIYHLALENEHYHKNYGIYANGLLVETCSKRYLKELSHMELLE